jgi:hypothetical protein
MRTCFSACDLSKLAPGQWLLLEVWCRFENRCPVWEEAGRFVHIDLECNRNLCMCAIALKPWRDECGGWSTSKETRRG